MTITLIDIIDDDFVNYKKPSMYIAFPKCTFKCGADVCQNYPQRNKPQVQMEDYEIVDRYMNNPFTNSIVISGLEPFDDPIDLTALVNAFRERTEDDIVIYTGYTEDEVKEHVEYLVKRCGIKNMIIKYGRYIPGNEPHYDEVLGVRLASPNQYAKAY